MTLPYERARALRQIPNELMDVALTPGPVSKRALRRLVSRLLRHYPTPCELERIERAAPELLQAPDP